ncbi:MULTISPECIES: hypothetical protein [Gluconobacter]|uniref:Uncharacterized protein n=1 Tax=Gluconobacter japonicus TaxID=376620 RepID=A0ABQ5WK14_GLUJA|nr:MULTISPECIES: hypothetical protein [Gluconobacter]MBS1028670.1 hypothetical protein [Gluconobacter albidus]MBS1031759.1 hypothetical protein [Gluconobacter cerinus]MBS1044297.1 hypothetical protein [Gluconobacter cerinus]MBS1055126.1 hypothetical protein [Gluconobacter kondonii]MBS1056901.1 hypothetical protein [Gluconobacter kondonii]
MSRQTVIRIGALIIQVAILLLIWQGFLHPIRGGLLVLAVGGGVFFLTRDSSGTNQGHK